MDRGLFDYGSVWQEQILRCLSYIAPLKSGGGQQVQSVLLSGGLGTGKTAIAAYMAECSSFPFVKVVSGNDMTGLFENSKVNYIKKVFDDAHKSPYSVIILDEIEDLIDYTIEGPRFSGVLLQTLRRMIKKIPQDGNRILIVGTTAAPLAMKQLGFWDQWNIIHHVLEISRADISAVLSHMEVCFYNKEEEAEVELLNPHSIPIKKLIGVIEMARALALGADAGNKLDDSETVWKPIMAEHWKRALENLGLW